MTKNTTVALHMSRKPNRRDWGVVIQTTPAGRYLDRHPLANQYTHPNAGTANRHRNAAPNPHRGTNPGPNPHAH